MLTNEKSANRNEHQNQKTEVFWHKNGKTDLKNSQNRKTENPSAPLHTVAMVTYCVTKMITTCSPVIGQFFDTMI